MTITIPQLLAIIISSSLLLVPLAFYHGYKFGYETGMIDEAKELRRRRHFKIFGEDKV